MKAVDTNTLEALICDAAKRKYNRQMDLKAFDQMADPEGVHVLQDLMIHTHRAGQVCEPHARCRVLIKVKGHDLPREAWLDVELKRFETLVDVESLSGSPDDEEG
jgi:hypothetical protein